MTNADNKGFHPTLDNDHPYIFIDSCMQAWPDADYGRANQHGVTVYAVTAWDPHVNAAEALDAGMFWHLIARKYPNTLVITSLTDIRQAKQEGKAGFLLAAQGGDFLGDKLSRVEAFYRLGLRMMLPAYNRSNGICAGCLDRNDGGLSRFGELVVDECNRVGLLLDCTHIGHRSSLEIIERSNDPVVFSHSNPNAVVDNPRNISDEQIRACTAKGGVIGLAPWGPLVLQPGQTTQPTVDEFINHIDYVVQLTGSTDHIGIGTDMSLGTYPDHLHDPWGEPIWPNVADTYSKLITADVRSPLRALDGFSNYPQITNLIDHLGRRGYSDDDIRKLLGENYLRVFGQVWK